MNIFPGRCTGDEVLIAPAKGLDRLLSATRDGRRSRSRRRGSDGRVDSAGANYMFVYRCLCVCLLVCMLELYACVCVFACVCLLVCIL